MSIGMNIILAFLAGSVGSIIGGLQGFIAYGWIGLFAVALKTCGVDVTFLEGTFMNLFFLPAVMFNGNAMAAAYTGRKYADFPGENITKGLGHYSDCSIILVGGLGGVIGYSVFSILNALGVPADTGALAMIIVGIGIRMTFKGKACDKGALQYVLSGEIFTNLRGWAYPVFMAFIVAAASAILIKEVSIWNIGFLVSAASMIYTFVDPSFPATHHITLVAGYALQMTGNIVLAIVFGVLAQIVAILFEMIFNIRCGTHIDPPGFAIMLFSILLFVFF
ncbi:MAG: hypothetical protein Q4C49_14115 [Bacillota bacterium]|nr:hypothetical protein [Bacillota bacterium]